MKKKLSAFDAFLATSFVVICIWLLTLIPINADILNPIEKTFSDFELTDIYFSHIKKSSEVSSEIVLINIGHLPREGIAEMISILNEYSPRVIGLDAFFRHRKTTEGDSLLQASFREANAMVLVTELYENEDAEQIDSIGYSHPYFMEYASAGFADMLTEGKDVFKVSRKCIPWELYNGDTILSFPVQLAMHYAPEKARAFINRGNPTEEISYQGNIVTHVDGVTENSKNVFFAMDVHQVFDRAFEPEAIRDKIVILGFMGSTFGDPSWEDKFFTPLNANYLGKTNPDMFGVVAHANILAMILKGDFINDVPSYIEISVSLLLIFLNTWLFGWLFLNLKEWWDGVNMLVALFEVLIITSISITVFHLFSYKFDTSFLVITLFLSGNMIEFYFGLIVNYFRRRELRQKRNKTIPDSNQVETITID